MTKSADDLLKAAIAAHRANDLMQAKTLYEEALIHEPHRPEILFNLGSVLIALRRMEEAAYCFEEVLKVDPAHIPSHYFLGNCYFSLEKFDLAQKQYEYVLSREPGHIDALNNLGALLLHQKNYEQAMQCFSAVLTGKPDHLEARNNLAATLMEMQRHYHAAEHFRFILEHKPDDISAHYGYAIALLDSGDFPEAINQFKKLLERNPSHLDALSNLGIAYLKGGYLDEAKITFEQTLQQQPVNPEIDYLYRALTGKTPPATPPSIYIKNLFDHYAKHYEQHVVDTLHYTVPIKLRRFLEKYVQPLPDRAWEIMDLGCGTGLSGLEFRGLAAHLYGVDLSQRMLTLAKDKLIYNELVEDDLIHCLEHAKIQYDLLLAADTFNYFGDFSRLFSACHQALRSSGWLLFSAEADENTSSWNLQQNARYAHNKNYIMEIAHQTGFEVIAIENAFLREQEGKAVNGWLCLLKGIHG